MIDVFITKVLEDAPLYEAWGIFVASEIMKGVLIEDAKKKNLLKVPVQIRVKQESSIRGKVAKYNNADPKDVVKDLVGVRFIVLLTSELHLIQTSLSTNVNWTFEVARDFEVQAMKNPELFDYQSIHYIVTAARNIDVTGVVVPAGFSCEVQIRTLLQHAYAELTHDNIYKPTQLVPQKAKRFVARSMALMEATDDLFCRTLDELRDANAPRNDLYDGLTEIFKEFDLWDERKIDRRINLEILDVYRPMIDWDTALTESRNFLLRNDFVVDYIKRERLQLFLFRQPVVLLIYILVESDDYRFKMEWVFESLIPQLRLIYHDLGLAYADQL
jgi:ppGpp synthetase/RelA/SpoT-type nucleotidyltranferase